MVRPGRRAGQPVAITGAETRDRVHLLRAQSDAIMIGVGTVLADDPLLTCRLPGMEKRSPVRVVLDSALRLPRTSRLVQTASEVPLWVIAAAGVSRAAEEWLVADGVVVLRAPKLGNGLDLAGVLKQLADRGITRLMVEGGPTLAAAFIAADLVDEAILFHSAKIVGADGIDALAGMPLAALTQAPLLRRVMTELLGPDRCDVFERR